MQEENQVLFDREAAELEAINQRHNEHKLEAEHGLQTVRKLIDTTSEELTQRISSVEADITARLEAGQSEAEKSRLRISEDIEDVRGRLAEHEARQEKAEAGLRLHEKAIDEVRQEMRAED